MRPPRFWRALLCRSVGADCREDLDADLAEEFDARAREESPAAARRWYRRQALGFVFARLRRITRRGGEARWSIARWITVTDVRLAMRLIRRQPIAAATSILALGTAIAVSVAAFTFARGFVFPDLDIPGGNRLSQVRMNRTAARGTEHPRPAEVLAWTQRARTVESVGAFHYTWPTLQADDIGDPPRPIEAVRVTPGPLARISPAPLIGRHLNDADAAPGAEPVVVISEALWRGRFGADPGVVGRAVELNGERHAVVGVMPAGWTFPVNQQAWLALPLERLAFEGTSAAAGSYAVNHRLVVWTILAPASSRESSAAELESLARSVAPAGARDEFSVSVLSYVDGFTNGLGPIVATIVLALLLVLLSVVSLNVASLVLARCAARTGELAVRAALGASRGRIIAQLFVESLVIGVTASALGTYVVYHGLEWARDRMGAERPFWMDLSVDPWVMLYAATLAVLASALAGVLPALRVTRGDSARCLHASGTRLVPVALGRVTSVLLAVQLAASLGLLALAGLLAEGLLDHSRTPRGPHDARILTAVLYLDPNVTGVNPTWGSPELQRLRLEIEAALAAIPGAAASAVALSLPRTDADYDRLLLDGADLTSPVRVQRVFAGPGLFEVLGVAPRSGRTFSARDARPEAPVVAVVSQRFVDDVLRGSSPIGRRFQWVRDEPRAGGWVEIVGVVPDLAMDPGDRTARGEVFLPLVGSSFMYAAVRSAGSSPVGAAAPEALAPSLRRAIGAVDPRIRITDVQSLTDVGWETRAALAGGSTLLLALGAMTLLLSLAGIYALASLAVTSRTREIGLRVALGATSADVIRTVLRRSLMQLGSGTAGGVVLAIVLSRATLILPFSIPGSVGLAVLAAGSILLAAGVLASAIPVRRALRIDPMAALRAD